MNTPKTFEQEKNLSVKNNGEKNNVKQLDLAEILSNQETETESNLPTILNLPEVAALKKQVENEDKDIIEYFKQLVSEIGFDKEKLDKLYEGFVSKKVEEVLVKIEESGYDSEKIEYLLGEEVVEKLNQVKGKVKAIQEGTLTIEEKIKKLGLAEKTANTTKGFLKKIKGFLKIGKDSVTESIKEVIFGTQNKMKELEDLKPEIEQLVEEILNSENELVESAKDYYKAYLALSFMEIAYNKSLKDLSESKSSFAQARAEKQATMIKNRLARIRTSKVLLETASINHLKLSEKVQLIADNLKNEYEESKLVLGITLHSLITQEKIRNGVDLSNGLQDLKNTSISAYMQSMRDFNNAITHSFESSKNTSEILTKEIKLLTQNIKENERRISQIDKEVKSSIAQMNKAVLELKKVVEE